MPITIDELRGNVDWYAGAPEVYPPDDVYWLTFAGQAFTGLTRDQWAVLYVMADDMLGYKAIIWCHAPKHYPSNHPFNIIEHAKADAS